MHFKGYGYCCPSCASDSFYCENQRYDGTHENEDREYCWANVPEHQRNGIVVYRPDGTCDPEGYRYPPDRWTTRASRLADPLLAAAVESTEWSPCIAVMDYTWFKCSGCQREVDADYANQQISRVRTKHPGLPIIYEEIGQIVINDYSVSRIEIND